MQFEVSALSLRDVCEKTSLSRTTIYDGISAGTFPSPARYGSRSLWLLDEVNAWIKARFAERDAKEARA